MATNVRIRGTGHTVAVSPAGILTGVDELAGLNEPRIRDAAAADLDVTTLYKLLRLRIDVFVVEQECPYAELDGRDLEPGARQLWAESSGEIVATLRVLDEGPVARIGRVATAASARSTGLAGRLMQRALELAGDRDVVLDAQSYLQGWYERFGFARVGEEYVEDGIPHVPMRRSA
jgi:ElaA protein